MNELIAKEEEKARSLEERTKVFSSGYSGDKDHEKSLEELHSKVKEVYRKTLSDNDANLSTLQMLTNIENHLESLFELIETMPQDKVEQAEKIKEKERRQRIREEKLEAQKMLQEERVRKALERAKAPVKVAVSFGLFITYNVIHNTKSNTIFYRQLAKPNTSGPHCPKRKRKRRLLSRTRTRRILNGTGVDLASFYLLKSTSRSVFNCIFL